MVSQHDLRDPLAHKLHDELDNGRAVWASIHQVAHKNQGPLRDTALRLATQPGQQSLQCANLTVYITDDVHWATHHLLYQLRHNAPVYVLNRSALVQNAGYEPS